MPRIDQLSFGYVNCESLGNEVRWGAHRFRHAALLVKVRSEDGTVGLGLAWAHLDDEVSFARAAQSALAATIVGSDALSPYDTGKNAQNAAYNAGVSRAGSVVEMALWDLAGKTLGASVTTLLGGKFRDKVRVYDHRAPRDILDKASCKEWADKCKADPAGFTCHKFSLKHTTPDKDPGRDLANRVLSTRELLDVRRGFENCREAIGWDHDIMVHCHWEYDVRTAMQIAEAVAPIKPFWFEDPLSVEYSPAWSRLCAAASMPICTGENLFRRHGFKDFIVNQGCDILHPDLRNSGGFLETKRIADFAEVFNLPMATHNTGSQLNTWATVHWAGSIRDYLCCETVTGKGDWMDQVLALDRPYIKGGMIELSAKAGLGVELNPDVCKAHLATGESWWG